MLPIESGICLALDPVHSGSEGEYLFDLVRGTYRAQAFYTDFDSLGLRVFSAYRPALTEPNAAS